MWTLKIEADAVIQDPSPACALTSRGGDFLAVSSVPDASVKISQRLPAPWSLLLNIWRRPGPCCGASVGTSGSAPCARACRPWSVGIAKYLNAKRTKLNKTQQNSDLPTVTESDQIWMQKQQNSAKLSKTRTYLPSSKATKFECKNSKPQQNSDLPSELKSDQIWTQKQQNSAKLRKTRTYLPSSKAIKFECKNNKTQQNWTKLPMQTPITRTDFRWEINKRKKLCRTPHPLKF